MKNLIIILIAIFGISLFVSCEKDQKDPKLDIGQTVLPSITSPSNGSAFILLKDEAANTLVTFEWTPTKYNLTDLETTKYILQMDLAGSNFSDPYDLVSTSETSYSMTVGQMNGILLSVLELTPEEVHSFDVRVKSFVNSTTTYSNVYSSTTSIDITPYDETIYIKPIYVLGDASPAGWDNTLATPIQHIGSGKFAGVITLNATGDWIKFISVLGAWAPQWGTIDGADPEGDVLVYRPDEQTTDPTSIPSQKVAGDYYIMADTANLLYEIHLTSGQLFLVGDATPAGWDAGAAIAFTQSEPHIFTLTTNLNAGGGMKFLEVQGAWAPQYGTNEKGNARKGVLIYRATESVPDPPSIPGPNSAGSYKITVDLMNMEYTIEGQ